MRGEDAAKMYQRLRPFLSVRIVSFPGQQVDREGCEEVNDWDTPYTKRVKCWPLRTGNLLISWRPPDGKQWGRHPTFQEFTTAYGIEPVEQ